MANHKVNILEKKEPWNLSQKKYIILNFESYCDSLEIDKNALIESILKDFLHEVKFGKKDKKA
ncbi:hypothetical protein AVT43_gp49 [Polaribacter phage P12002L]|uniref:Uncharacterized protein n=2 Tax=Incheonvirus TaxID=2976977 RepID=A0A0F7ILK8_9CAUD|nr:hypothetical protein AVT42_gp47 [Polaribacter phage P12002S]YP_009209709.1 hypothetical protein AVT43_gp49 [Polaribacter phage P12002L]AKG94223.1 hypothetical protein P12002L_0049 [Polaribacter phage P12002L]AKG94303.1 hypothetical protein P12002S_0047 [Polaribacter phage P12002S]